MQILPRYEWQAPEKPFYFQDDSRNIALVGGTGAGNPWYGTGSGGMGLPVHTSAAGAGTGFGPGSGFGGFNPAQ